MQSAHDEARVILRQQCCKKSAPLSPTAMRTSCQGLLLLWPHATSTASDESGPGALCRVGGAGLFLIITDITQTRCDSGSRPVCLQPAQPLIGHLIHVFFQLVVVIVFVFKTHFWFKSFDALLRFFSRDALRYERHHRVCVEVDDG